MSSVVVPALVAAVVTLGIEYFAKPALEVRKDRILERHRRRRTLDAHLRGLAFWLSPLRGVFEDSGSEVEKLDGEVHRAIQVHYDGAMAALTTGATDDDFTFAEAEALNLLTAGWSVYLTRRAEGRDRAKLAHMVTEHLVPVTDLLGHVLAPNRGLRARRRADQALRLARGAANCGGDHEDAPRG